MERYVILSVKLDMMVSVLFVGNNVLQVGQMMGLSVDVLVIVKLPKIEMVLYVTQNVKKGITVLVLFVGKIAQLVTPMMEHFVDKLVALQDIQIML